MLIDELKQCNEAVNCDCDDVADKLIELSNLGSQTEDIKALHEAVSDALYQLKASAQNPYNNDYYRIFYNVLLVITGFAFY